MRPRRFDRCGCGSGKLFVACHYREVEKAGATDYLSYQQQQAVDALRESLLVRSDRYVERVAQLPEGSGPRVQAVFSDVLLDLDTAREALALAATKVMGGTLLEMFTHTELMVEEILAGAVTIDALREEISTWKDAEELCNSSPQDGVSGRGARTASAPGEGAALAAIRRCA